MHLLWLRGSSYKFILIDFYLNTARKRTSDVLMRDVTVLLRNRTFAIIFPHFLDLFRNHVHWEHFFTSILNFQKVRIEAYNWRNYIINVLHIGIEKENICLL